MNTQYTIRNTRTNLYWSANLNRSVNEWMGGYTTYTSKARAEMAIRRDRYLKLMAVDLEVVPEPAALRAAL